MENWKNLNIRDVGYVSEVDANSWSLVPLLKSAIFNKDNCVFNLNVDGNIEESPETFVKKLLSLNGRMIYKEIYARGFNSLWIWEDSMVQLNAYPASLEFAIYSLRESFVKELGEYFRSFLKPVIQKGYVFAITSGSGQLSFTNIGNAGIVLNRNNYAPKVLQAYDYIVDDLNSTSPAGRIVVLHGTPGSGKTHMIRSLLLDVPNGMFVLVPPDLITALGGPQFLPLLLSHKSYSKGGPIVLILEDADKCLVARQDAENMNSIQALLNLSDGILGNLLDLRIVATTNAKQFEMDPAILRPGRLTAKVEIGTLDNKSALKVFSSLLPELKESKYPSQIWHVKELTLAEIYALAREAGWHPKE